MPDSAEMRDSFPLFAACYQGFAFTVGYRATSVSGSANRMVNYMYATGKKVDLAGVRDVNLITVVYSQKEKSGGIFRRFRLLEEVMERNHVVLPLERNVNARLEALIEKARELKIFRVRDGRMYCEEKDHLYLVDQRSCSCGVPVFSAILLRVLRW
jgi:hypothetical protein